MCLAGESGSGKSVMRLLPRGSLHIVAGSIWLGDCGLATLGEGEIGAVRGCDVAMIFQQLMISLNPEMSVGKQIVGADTIQRSLLAGLLYDEDGIVMTPTHANKKGRRYRYYVSPDLIGGRKPKANTGSSDGQPPAGEARLAASRPPTSKRSSSRSSSPIAPRSIDIEERRRSPAICG